MHKLTWIHTAGIVPAEIFDTHTRSKGVSIATMVSFAFNTMIGQVTPVALDRVGWRFYSKTLGQRRRLVLAAACASPTPSWTVARAETPAGLLSLTARPAGGDSRLDISSFPLPPSGKSLC